MAIDECAVCSDPCVRSSAANTELSFRNAILSLLCQFYQTETDAEVAAVVLPQIVKTAAQLTSSYSTYANTGLLDTSKELRYVRILNDSDAALDFSLDGGATTHFTVPAYSVYDRELGQFIAAAQTSFQMRITSGSAASVGDVKIEGLH